MIIEEETKGDDHLLQRHINELKRVVEEAVDPDLHPSKREAAIS